MLTRKYSYALVNVHSVHIMSIISHALSTLNTVFAYLFIGGLINEMRFLFAFCYSNVTDKVFSPTCSTQKVYEEGAKDVALSALTGINGSCNL